jgi:hypothetical protein
LGHCAASGTTASQGAVSASVAVMTSAWKNAISPGRAACDCIRAITKLAAYSTADPSTASAPWNVSGPATPCPCPIITTSTPTSAAIEANTALRPTRSPSVTAPSSNARIGAM